VAGTVRNSRKCRPARPSIRYLNTIAKLSVLSAEFRHLPSPIIAGYFPPLYRTGPITRKVCSVCEHGETNSSRSASPAT